MLEARFRVTACMDSGAPHQNPRRQNPIHNPNVRHLATWVEKARPGRLMPVLYSTRVVGVVRELARRSPVPRKPAPGGTDRLSRDDRLAFGNPHTGISITLPRPKFARAWCPCKQSWWYAPDASLHSGPRHARLSIKCEITNACDRSMATSPGHFDVKRWPAQLQGDLLQLGIRFACRNIDAARAVLFVAGLTSAGGGR